MKALVFHGDKDLRLEEAAEPIAGPEEEMILVAAVGICGSDVHGYLGLTGRRTPPMIMGHEFAGKRENGEAVAVFPYQSCGGCQYCKEGATASCPDKRMFGVFAENGGMAEKIAVRKDRIIPLPPETSPIHAAMAEPLSVAFHAVKKAKISPEKKVVIIGAGAIGMLCLVLVRQMGAKKITVLDIDDSRLRLAKRVGADEVIHNAGEDHPPATFDIVIEAVGIADTVRKAISLTNRGGSLVLVGMSQKEIPVDMFDIISREIVLTGSFQYTRSEFETVVNMLPQIKGYLDLLISHVVPLSKGVEMFHRLASGEAEMTKVVLEPNGANKPGEGNI